MSPQWIGLFATAVLLATIVKQLHRQYHAGVEGVSTWLFVGQTVASVSFLTYSVLIGDTVFIAANGLMTLTALVGLVMVRRAKRRSKPAVASPADPADPAVA
jgi:lipid-A-disaccharide synthase-like uncharacterized protein